MKTETIIVEENIKLLKQRMQTFETNARRKGLCISHKASCQRFLEFLKDEMRRWEISNALSETYMSTGELEEKITDLQNAIKKYDEVGI